jgi:hypothetical protein
VANDMIETQPNISALARAHGVSRATVRRRLANGWTPPVMIEGEIIQSDQQVAPLGHPPASPWPTPRSPRPFPPPLWPPMTSTPGRPMLPPLVDAGRPLAAALSDSSLLAAVWPLR